jgi:hypothetical protein
MNSPDNNDRQLLIDANLTITEAFYANSDLVYIVASDTLPYRNMLRESRKTDKTGAN